MQSTQAKGLCKLVFDFQGGKIYTECEDVLKVEDAVQRAYAVFNSSICLVSG